ncbi:MAG: hypothetical protein ACE366_18235 [Bradymonadia bacterium]
MRALVFITLSLLISTSASAGTITFKGCSASDQSNIKQAVQWLKDNISKIDAKMGKGALMSWPGNSRKKWLAKLDKDLKFVCKNAKKKCQRVSKSGTVLYGQVVPVFQQKTVQLCTNHFTRGMSDYVGTIAHEIGHLVRLNAHRTNCKKLCEKPRFSQSVGIAAEIAYTGGSYSAKACKKSCD